jgi:hypothetical protein
MLEDNLPPKPNVIPGFTRIQDILSAGTTRGKQKGWRAKELGVAKVGSRDEHFQNLLHEDTKELLGFLSAKSTGGNGGST